ncbi:MAG: cytochrome c oxidase subunit 3 [Anaerolineae bacterium]|nr:cytochrome c oxidase subunit 3 [Anaerolineae bacterium]
MALLIWRISNGLIFVFFIFANYLMRSVQTSWPPEGAARPDILVPGVVSILLLLSSIPAARALNAIRRGDNTNMSRNIWLVLAAGLLFIAGVIFTMVRLPYSGPYSSIINAMSGFHIVHAFVGMLLLAYVLRRASAYTPENHWTVEATVVFWHFVDLMWVFFFAVIYFI